MPVNGRRDGVLICIPTLGLIPIHFLQSQITMAVPIHTTIAYAFIMGQEVGEARNQFAKSALEGGYRYILFRDDDTLIPRELLQRLYALHTPICAGVYFSKTYPPEPLIFRQGRMAGCQDWKMGDVLTDVDSCGMGATLIDVRVFEKLKESNPDLPFFKTEDVKLALRGNAPGVMTEDIYFLTRCKEELRMKRVPRGDTWDTEIYTIKEAPEDAIPVQPVIDTSLQCAHIDKETWTQFYYHEELKVPVWVTLAGEVNAVPPIGHPSYDVKPDHAEHVNGKPIKLDLGSGNVPVEGYMTVDLNPDTNPDILADITDLSWVRKRFGRGADAIRSCHSLEHIPHLKVMGTIRSWSIALVDGGTLEVGVPDFWWCVDDLRKNEEETLRWQKVFGAQRYSGDAHLTGFSEARLRAIFRALPWMEITSIETKHEADKNQPTIWLKAVKKVPVPGHIQAEETNTEEACLTATSP